MHRTGRAFLAGFDNYSTQFLSLDGKCLKNLRAIRGDHLFEFSPSGKSILTGSKDGTARLWDLNGHCIQEFSGYENMVMSVDFSFDEKSILVGSLDKNARIWDVPMVLANYLQSNKMNCYLQSKKEIFR